MKNFVSLPNVVRLANYLARGPTYLHVPSTVLGVAAAGREALAPWGLHFHGRPRSSKDVIAMIAVREKKPG